MDNTPKKKKEIALYGVDFTSGEMLAVEATDEEEARQKAIKAITCNIVSGTIKSIQWIGYPWREVVKTSSHEDMDITDPVVQAMLKAKGAKGQVNPEANANVDVVKDPPHYQHGMFEVIDEMVIAFGYQKTIDFCILNAWKYRSRAPYKGKFEEDMDKANRYMEYAYQLQLLAVNYNGPQLLHPGKKKDK